METAVHLLDHLAGKKYEYVVFGASGFTGQFVVEELARLVVSDNRKRHWAVAGRSETKLRETLRLASEHTGIKLQDVPIIIADVKDDESLLSMAKQTKVILNCVGPYRFFGEPVVKAAVEGGAHHVDISGEPSYLEGMQLKYDEAAKAKGVYIVGACGWDSIPSEMGIEYTREQFDGTLNDVETVVELNGGLKGLKVHFGTFQSMIHGFANRGDLKALRKQVLPNPVPRSTHKPPKRGILFYHEGVNGWCLPFMGADKPVAQRTNYFDYHTRGWRPVQVQTYVKVPSILHALGMMIWAIFFGIMASFKAGRDLLEKYPKVFSAGVFSHEGPTREELKDVTFSTHVFGRGWLKKQLKAEEDPAEPPTDKITCKVTGPDPGYFATSACLVASAKTLLEEAATLPSGGGVLTPGAAFAKSKHFIDYLRTRGFTFNRVN